MLAGAFAAACLLVPALAAGAEAPGVVTLMEGPAALLRTAGRFALAEGVRLQAGDIVEVPDKGLVQLELASGTRVSLGPQSRFHVAALAGAGSRGGKEAAVSDFYLLQGWSKFALAPRAAPLRVTTPLFGFGSAEAVLVLQVESAEASLFVERGAVRLAEGFVKATPASPVAVGWTLDLDHVGAEPGQHLRARRASLIVGKVDDADPVQCLAHARSSVPGW